MAYEGVIKSIGYNQHEILYNIMQLHNDGKQFDCDPTYSIGNFYGKFNITKDNGETLEIEIPQPKYKFDVCPQVEGVEKIEPLGPLPLEDNSISSNGDLARSTLANAKTLLDIKDDDKDYNGLLGNIVSEDRDKTSAICSYIAKYVNDAYEKGKKDATKDAMGEFGKGKFSGNGGAKKETESLGAKLAKNSPGFSSKNNVDYFKR